MRDRFTGQLKSLHKGLIEMGEQCESVITMATDALINNNKAGAESVSVLDTDIDHQERDIESLCLKLLLQQQPVASDLRQISAALKMITDMERIGDQAADIAELVKYIDGDPIINMTKIGDMAKHVIYMVTESVNAYVKKDVTLAQNIIKYDDEVDDLFNEMKNEIIDIIAKKNDDAEKAVDLLMIAKYLERIGDHATNIAEWAVFSVTGVHKSDELS
ncbi:MAG: phosphate signaling complex protein PhoU [Lachnospiraceae bacterium]|nr:phosphate signaling complex protein PhoU [Lachnospiraceae bacterium]